MQRTTVWVSLILWLLTLAWCQAQTITDGFGDADRNNDGVIDLYDTDVNLSGTLNDPVLDAGLMEIETAEDASDVGVIWSATRGFTGSNDGDPKPNLKVVDDSAGFGTGYALSYEAKGGGSSAIGAFGQSIAVGPNVGDKVVVSLNFRINPNTVNPTAPPAQSELRWGLFQDTDNQLGMSANVGQGNVPAVWGLEDGLWRDSSPGAEGDKGLWTRVPIGVLSDPSTSRNNFEYNLLNINGTSNNARFLEGSGSNADPGVGGDVGTIASPGDDGPGAKIGGDLVSDPTNQIPVAPHTLRLEIERTADTLLVSSYVDDALSLSDVVSLTSANLSPLGPAPDSFDYVAFRNQDDWDFLMDNFSITAISVPEPGMFSLLSLALVGWVLQARRRG